MSPRVFPRDFKTSRQDCWWQVRTWDKKGEVSEWSEPAFWSMGLLDPKEWKGFAFGWGVERNYMMKAGIKVPDIRVMYNNELGFLEQF